MAFPTLSLPPLEDNYAEIASQDPVIRSSKEAGYDQTRPRFTRVPDQFHLSYTGMNGDDYSALKSWELATMFGASADTWAHPRTGATLNVRLAGPIKYGIKNNNWTFEFDLKVV